MYPFTKSLPLAGQLFNLHLRQLLIKFATYFPPPSGIEIVKPLPSIPENLLTEEIIENFKTRGCFIGDPLTTAQDPSTLPEKMNLDTPPTETELTSEFYESLRVRYETNSHATSLPLRIPLENSNQFGTLFVPGWIRERSGEIFFDKFLTNWYELEETLVETILECILSVSLFYSNVPVEGSLTVANSYPSIYVNL